MEFHISEYGEVTSTNDVVKEAIAAGEPEGLAVVARTQTAGYGRRGNKWESAPGSLYMSLLLRPEKPLEQLQTLSLLAAVAVRRALAGLVSASADALKVKWPNDVVYMAPGDDGVRFNKLCGISVEQKDGAVCIGIGVNVDDACIEPSSADSRAPNERSKPPRNRPTFLSELAPAGECPSVEEVRDAVLGSFSDAYDVWGASSFEPFCDEYMEHFALEGFKIRIDDSGEDGPVRCEVTGITPEGHLVVLPEGEASTKEIVAGTVTVVR